VKTGLWGTDLEDRWVVLEERNGDGGRRPETGSVTQAVSQHWSAVGWSSNLGKGCARIRREWMGWA